MDNCKTVRRSVLRDIHGTALYEVHTSVHERTWSHKKKKDALLACCDICSANCFDKMVLYLQ
jgi:hypothetical protein